MNVILVVLLFITYCCPMLPMYFTKYFVQHRTETIVWLIGVSFHIYVDNWTLFVIQYKINDSVPEGK